MKKVGKSGEHQKIWLKRSHGRRVGRVLDGGVGGFCQAESRGGLVSCSFLHQALDLNCKGNLLVRLGRGSPGDADGSYTDPRGEGSSGTLVGFPMWVGEPD